MFEPNHVGLFLPDLTVGGVERVITTLSQEFVSKGIETDIILVNAQGELLDQIPKEVSIVDLDCGRLRYSLLGLRRYIRNQNPDVILSAMNPPNIMALLASRMAPVETRCVTSLHCSITPVYQGTDNKKRKVIFYGMEKLYPHADQIISVSEGISKDAADCLGLPEYDISTIYNPIPVKEIQTQSKEEVDHPWFEKDPPVIVGAGRHATQKDFPTLLRAFQQLQSSKDARLLLLGNGPETANLQHLTDDLGIGDYVDFPGYVDNLYKYLRHGDVFVLSSSHEGFGNVLAESMAVGTPVVSTDCPVGPSEILEGGKWGPLVPVGDKSALATAIENTLADPPEREKLIERAQDFDSETIAEEYIQVLFGPGDA